MTAAPMQSDRIREAAYRIQSELYMTNPDNQKQDYECALLLATLVSNALDRVGEDMTQFVLPGEGPKMIRSEEEIAEAVEGMNGDWDVIECDGDVQLPESRFLKLCLWAGILRDTAVIRGRALRASVLRESLLTSRSIEIQKLVFVPGVFHCSKCGLELVVNNMVAGTGEVFADNEPQICLDNCGLMEQVTERNRRIYLESRLEAPKDYDGSIAVLAQFLPDGWVAQDCDGRVDWYAEQPEHEGRSYWYPRKGRKAEPTMMRLPAFWDWRTSDRLIQSGKVVPQ